MTETTRTVTKNYRNRIPLNTQTLTKTNYSHYGWEDPNGTKFRTSDTIDLTRDITLTAVWGVSITYYQDDTANSPSYTVPTVYIPSQTYDVLAGTHDNFSAFDVTGKTITSWTEGSTTGTSRQPGYQYNIDINTVNIKLYAVWTDTYYTLTYYNGSPSYPETNTILKDTLVTVRGRVMANATKIVNSTNSNFGLAGWANTQTGTSVTYDPYGTNSNSLPKTFTIRSNTNLNAVWGTVAGVTVAYTVSNGAAAVTDQNSPYVSGKTVTVLAPTNPDGYTFNRWQLSGTTTYYNPTNTFNIASATTLIAQWTAKSIVMSYDTNSSSTVPKPADRTHTYDQSGECKTADISPLIYNNKTFAGWNESSTPSYTGDPLTISSTMYEKNKAFSSTTFKTSKTLYAVWGAKVTYVAASGDTVGSLPTNTTVYITGQTIPVSTSIPTKSTAPSGFVRWNNGSAAATSILVDLNTTNPTFTAVWGYTLSYNGNGYTSASSTVPSSNNYAAGDTFTTSSGTGLAKTGWTTLVKWNTSANINGTDYALNVANNSMPATDRILYAVWGPAITISYNAGTYGTFSSSTPSQVTLYYNQKFTTPASSVVTNSATPSRTIKEWNTSANGSGTPYSVSTLSTYTLSGSQTLYAVWQLYVTVTYKKFSGSTVASETTTHPANYIDGNTITAITYTTPGWSNGSNRLTGWLYGSTSVSENNSILTVSSSTPNNISLVAVWTPTYTINYYYNNNTLIYGTTFTSSHDMLFKKDLTMSNSSSKFIGWGTSSSGNVVVYNEPTTFTESINLYAKWTSTGVKLNYSANVNVYYNTTGDVPADVYVNCGDSVTLSAGTIKWNSNSVVYWGDGVNGSVNFGAPGDSINVYKTNTVYARWN